MAAPHRLRATARLAAARGAIASSVEVDTGSRGENPSDQSPLPFDPNQSGSGAIRHDAAIHPAPKRMPNLHFQELQEQSSNSRPVSRI
jgi:hypothetical protein